MASFNRVILIGNLTRDPELRYLASGMAVTDIGLAVNDRRKNANGEWIEETTFVDVTLWGRTAEVASEYLSKGSPVFIEGRLKLGLVGRTSRRPEAVKTEGRGRADAIDRRPRPGRPGRTEGAAPRPAAKPSPQRSQTRNTAKRRRRRRLYDAPPAEASGGDDIPF